MAAKGEASAFNAIIQAEREKKKKQQLADRIFGSGRRSSVPSSVTGNGNGNGRKAPTGPASLASRAGITKSSAGPKPNTGDNGPRYPTTFKPQPVKRGREGNQQRSVSIPQLNRRNQILANAMIKGGNAPHNLRNQIDSISQAVVLPALGEVRTHGINIRGMGEPSPTYVVIAQNFAPGTTAADIEAVLAPEPVENGLVKCRLVASNPTVIAELVFSKKRTADTIIQTFNNKKADGRLLHVYLQDTRADARRGRATPTLAPGPVPVNMREADMMDVEETRAYEDRRRTQGALHASQRGGRAQPAVQDGRYGFRDNMTGSSETSYQDDRRQPHFSRRDFRGGNDRQGAGLVSDAMIAPRNDRYDDSPGNGRNFRR